MTDLVSRSEIILNRISSFSNPKLNYTNRYLLFAEHNLISSEMTARHFFFRYGKLKKYHKKIFIAHSKKDKWIARRLASDLKRVGHDPWLDEIKIKVGDSIPESIQQGLEHAHYQIVILSNNSNQSQWVKIEWMSKFWDEVQKQKTIVIPALVENCSIPLLLKSKKWADFRESYNEGLEEVLNSIGR